MYDELIVLIPSHSLEDFPTELSEQPASSLLNAFAALMHPRLLATAGTLPRWTRADDVEDVHPRQLVIVPTACDEWIPGGWVERARDNGTTVISRMTDRDDMIAAALEPLGNRRRAVVAAGSGPRRRLPRIGNQLPADGTADPPHAELQPSRRNPHGTGSGRRCQSRPRRGSPGRRSPPPQLLRTAPGVPRTLLPRGLLSDRPLSGHLAIRGRRVAGAAAGNRSGQRDDLGQRTRNDRRRPPRHRRSHPHGLPGGTPGAGRRRLAGDVLSPALPRLGHLADASRA